MRRISIFPQIDGLQVVKTSPTMSNTFMLAISLVLLFFSVNSYTNICSKPSFGRLTRGIHSNVKDVSVRVEAHDLSIAELCFCGSVATLIGDIAVHPFDTIKIAQQTSG